MNSNKLHRMTKLHIFSDALCPFHKDDMYIYNVLLEFSAMVT